MGILFIFTLLNCFFLLIASLKNYQGKGEKFSTWYLFAHSIQIFLYVIYFAFRRYILFTKNCSYFLFFLFHDIFLIGVMLLISNMNAYLYVSILMFHYIIFFSLIVCKKMECEEGVEESNLPERTSLPRKTFIEMTEFMNE